MFEVSEPWLSIIGLGEDGLAGLGDASRLALSAAEIVFGAPRHLALADVDGEVLVVSQFTLFADCRHGRRPSFTDAGAPDVANELYEYFLTLVAQDVEHVAHGIFGADMKVDLVNDGPFTIVLDTDNL